MEESQVAKVLDISGSLVGIMAGEKGDPMDKQLRIHTHGGADVVFDSAGLTCRYEARRREDQTIEV